MVVFEARPPVGSPQQGLQRTGQVDKAVTHEEEHGDDGRDLVQVADQNAHLRDHWRRRAGGTWWLVLPLYMGGAYGTDTRQGTDGVQ